MRDDRLEPLVPADRLVGPNFVEPLPVGQPPPVAELEEGGGMPGRGLGKFLERVRIEVDLDHRKEPARLAVASPEDLVMPVRIFPAEPFERIDPSQRSEKSCFKPLALLAKEQASVIDVNLFSEPPRGSSDNQPESDNARR
jgi:hypothetical protein